MSFKTSLNDNGDVCITDGVVAWNFTGEAIVNQFHEIRAKEEQIRDMDYLANRAQPNRFIPKLISELESRADSAGAPRDEAYAMAVMLIRKYIGPDKT